MDISMREQLDRDSHVVELRCGIKLIEDGTQAEELLV